MSNSNNNLEFVKNVLDLKEIANLLNDAIAEKCSVELRVEDLPSMDIDSIITTTITEAIIDEEISGLRLSGPMINLMFKYKTYSLGTSSSQHDKFYFKSDGASLTITIYH